MNDLDQLQEQIDELDTTQRLILKHLGLVQWGSELVTPEESEKLHKEAMKRHEEMMKKLGKQPIF